MSTAATGYTRAGDGVTQSIRIFGWGMLGLTAAFVINATLTAGFDYPGAGIGGAQSLLQLAVYLGLVALAVWFVISTDLRSLRQDAATIAAFNAWFIRGAFFAVFFVGLADAAISFLRVEGLLAGVVGDEMERALGRPAYRGTYVHIPLIIFGFLVASITRTLGFIWLALLIVVAELLIVITRFIFSYEQAFMGDLVRFWYAALFLFASAYTLLEDGHVRVDVLYAGLGHTTKGFINAWGSLLLGVLLCWVILVFGMGSKTSIIMSPLANFEITQSGVGMYVKYLMAGFLGVFAISMMIQFVSYFLESVADWRDEPGRRERDAAAAH